MKKFILAFALISGIAHSAELRVPPPPPPVSQLQTFGSGLPLAEFLRITIGEMAQRSYVLTPAASQSTSLIAADLSRLKLKNPLPLVTEILKSQGLSIREVDGVLFVDKLQEQEAKSDEKLLLYRPRYRPISSLMSYFSVFPDLKFSFSAGIATPVSSPGQQQSGASIQTGAVTFSAQDKDPSFLVAKGSPSQLQSFRDFLSTVDTPLPEVMIRAYVLEVRDAENKDSAVSLVSSLLGGHLSITSGDVQGDSLRFSVPNLSLAIRYITGDSRVRLLSSPVLRAADGSTASANIGTETPTLGAVVAQANGSTQQSITYQQSGVMLSVSPRVLDDSIRLSISQELSSFVRTETGLSDTPTKLRRAFKSDVVAQSGEAILLGGLSESTESEAHQKSFRFFGGDSKSSSTSQLVVLLQVDRL